MAEKEKTISIREFRMWLQGVEEMQDAGWTPTAQQWTRIREKIDSITAGPVPPAAPPLQVAAPPFVNPGMGPVPRPAMEQAMPAGPSSLVPPSYRPQINPLLGGAGGQIKTPDIDTSANGYESGFV